MKKKLKAIVGKSIAIIGVISLSLGLVPVSKLQNINVKNVYAASQTQGDYSYEILKDGTAKLVKYNGNANNVSIPKKLGGATVTVIGEKAFEHHFNLGRVRMPSTVKVIGDYAFNGCGRLEDVIFPKALTTLGDYAFCGCAKIKKVQLSEAEGLTIIGTSCFTRCTSLNRVELGIGVETIGEFAFSECYDLESVSITSTMDDNNNEFGNIREVKKGAFYDDSQLSYIYFPDNILKRIEEYAFYNCSKLDVFSDLSNVEYIGKKAFYCCIFEGDYTINAKELEPYAFERLTVKGDVTLGENIKSLPDGCFASAEMQVLDLSKSLEKIGDATFAGTVVKDFDVPNANKNFAEEDDSLYSHDKTELVRIKSLEKKDAIEDDEESGEEDIDDGESGEDGMEEGEEPGEEEDYEEEEPKTEEYVLPEGIKTIGDYAFYGTCLGKNDETFLDIVIPEGVETIGKAGMSNMNLHSVTVPDSVKTLGESAFAANEKLKQVTLGKGVTELPKKVFFANVRMKELTTEGTVEKIGDEAFTNCNMDELQIGKAVKDISSKAFSRAKIVKYVVDKENDSFCSEDGDVYSKDKKKLCFVHYTPQKCDEEGKLMQYSSPYSVKDGVTTIGSFAFPKESYVTEVALPDSLQELEPYAFANLNACKEFCFPDTVTRFGEKSVGYLLSYADAYDLAVGTLLICSKDSAAEKYARENDIAHATQKPALNKQEVTLKGNETFALSVKGMENKDIFFTSTNTNVVSVDSKGVMTGRGKGSTYVVAAQGAYYLICKVTVTSEGTKLSKKFDDSGYTVFNKENTEEWVDNYISYNRNQDLSINANYGTYVYSTNNYTAVKATYPDGDVYIGRAEEGFQPSYERFHAFGESAKSEMSRYRMHEDTLVYSGIGNVDKYTRKTSSLKDMIASIGRTDKFDCFTSASIDFGVSKGYSGEWSSSTILRIYVPKDYAGGAYIDQYSHYPGEMEYLLAPGYKYEVVDAGVRAEESEDEETHEIEIKPQRYMSLRLIDETKKEPAPSPKPSTKPSEKKDVTSVTKSGITYKKSGKAAVVSKAKKNITKAKILDKVTIDGKKYKVTKINEKAFASCKKLKSVSLGANVTTIAKKSFYKCGKLSKITWNKKVKSIGADAFKGISKKAIFKVKNSYYKKTTKLLTKKVGFVKKNMKLKKY